MKILKKILLILSAIFILIQFIRPGKNSKAKFSAKDITNTIPVPDSVLANLKVACFDCHSNNTRYPWYTNLQPVGWFTANHITNGKMHLYFSEFGLLPLRRPQNKLKSTMSQIHDNEMPLPSYKWIHSDARLSEENKRLINDWAQWSLDNLSVKN